MAEPLNIHTREGRQKFYKRKLWLQVRARVLQEEPLCQQCLSLGILTPATDVDHLVDIDIRPDLVIKRSNLQSLCHKCHLNKTSGMDYSKGLNKSKWKP